MLYTFNSRRENKVKGMKFTIEKISDIQGVSVTIFCRTLKDTQYSPFVRLQLAKCMETFLKVVTSISQR